MDAHIKSEILLSKGLIDKAITNNLNCKSFLENILDKTPNEIDVSLNLWQFAFDNFKKWEIVEQKFKKIEPAIEHSSVRNATNTVIRQIPKTNLEKSTTDNQAKLESKILENAEIIIEFLTQVAYGKTF